MRSSRVLRTVLVLSLALVSVLAVSAPAHAQSIIYCDMNAQATQTPIGGNVYEWDISMIGNCSGDFQGPYAGFGSAHGTSDGLGNCSGEPVMQNLNLDVSLSLISAKGSRFSKLLSEHWTAPVTTYPILTPFLVENTAPEPSVIGVGMLSQHLGGRCDPTGSPATVVLSVRLR